MEFTCKFIDGPYVNKLAVVKVDKFVIGSRIEINGHKYTIQDGPAAKWFQMNQINHDSLCCNVKYVEPTPEYYPEIDPHKLFDQIKSLSHEDSTKFGLGVFCLSLYGENIFKNAMIMLETDGGGCIPEMKECILFASKVLHQDHKEFIKKAIDNIVERN